MGNQLRDLRLSCSLPAADIVTAVKAVHPKFDKPLLSKCEHPEDYGIAPLPSTIRAARALAPDWKPDGRSGDRHRLTCSIRCRLETDVYRRLLAQIHQDGFSTVQAWLTDHVLAYINARSGEP